MGLSNNITPKELFIQDVRKEILKTNISYSLYAHTYGYQGIRNGFRKTLRRHKQTIPNLTIKIYPNCSCSLKGPSLYPRKVTFIKHTQKDAIGVVSNG